MYRIRADEGEGGKRHKLTVADGGPALPLGETGLLAAESLGGSTATWERAMADSLRGGGWLAQRAEAANQGAALLTRPNTGGFEQPRPSAAVGDGCRGGDTAPRTAWWKTTGPLESKVGTAAGASGVRHGTAGEAQAETTAACRAETRGAWAKVAAGGGCCARNAGRPLGTASPLEGL